MRKASLEPRHGEAGSDKRRGGVGGSVSVSVSVSVSGSGGGAEHNASDGDETYSASGAAVYACGVAAYNRPQRPQVPQARDYQLACHHRSS